MLTKILKSPALSFFSKEALDHSSLLIEGLWDAPKALLSLVARKSTKKNIVIISGSRQDRLLDDLNFFSSDQILDILPWETLPGEDIAPSADITGKRLEILYELAHSKKPQIIHCSLQALLQKTISPKKLKKICHEWKTGDSLEFDKISDLLITLGYRKMPVASDKGEFAIRGGLLDIFPISAPEPYRIDFFGDTIESIRTFDPVGQRSIQKVDRFFLSPASEWQLLKQEEDLSLLWEYLGSETLVIFNELLSIEDHNVSIQSLPGSKTRFFSSFSEHLETINPLQKIFFSSTNIEELSDVEITERTGRSYYSGKNSVQKLSFEFSAQKFSTYRWQHPFIEIGDFFSIYDNKQASTGDEILSALSRFSESAIELCIVSASEAEEKKLKEKIDQQGLILPKKTEFSKGYL
ncbi:MAG: transcription-repair coupling factor, partial [Chlamydiae bacterium]|nr:transcription-repair coupling factor [Chlamydiota bacterium]